MKKATTEAAAKTLMTGAKIMNSSRFVGISMKKISTPVMVFTLASGSTRKPRYRKPQAVKELEERADIENAKQHPNFPEKYLPKSKYRDDTANGLTRCIIDWIKLHGGQAERVNSMGVPVDKRRQVTDVLGRTRTIGSVEWRRSGGTKGSADISATVHSKAVKIEVKIGRDRQSEAQREYQQAVEQAGGLYYIAKDFTSFVGWYHQNFG